MVTAATPAMIVIVIFRVGSWRHRALWPLCLLRRSLDGDVKMALAQRLEFALTEKSELLERIAQLEARGGDG